MSTKTTTEENSTKDLTPHLPKVGEQGGWIDDERLVESTGVVVGDDLESAHEEVEESRRRSEQACIFRASTSIA